MRLHVYRLVLLLLLVALPAYAQGPQSLHFPGGQNATGSSSFSNLHVGPGSVSISGGSGNGTDQISNVNVNGVINVKTYGARGDGVNDDTAAIQAAWNAAIGLTSTCVHFPAGTYLVTQDLNFTWNTTGIGTAASACIEGDDPSNTQILCEDTGGNCIDASGLDGFNIRRISMVGGSSSANAPKNLLLLARVGNTGFGHSMTDVWLSTNNNSGHTIYDYGDEIGTWNNVRSNSRGAVVISTCNAEAVTSRYQTLPTPPTSMSVINIYNGNYNAGGGTCAITLDNGCGTASNIRDINIWGTFFGEMAGGGTALCDKAGGTSPTLFNISITGVRLEVFDTNTNYKFIDFTHNNSYVSRLNLNNIMMGVLANQASPMINFGGFVDHSQLQIDFANEAPGVYVLAGPGGRGNIIQGLLKSQISPSFLAGASLQGTEGNLFIWFDEAPPYYGHTDAGGVEATNAMTQLTGTTTGGVIWNMPVHAANWKTVMLSFQSYENTSATAQVITYPVPFQVTPSVYGSCPAGLNFVAVGSVTLPASMSAQFSGSCFLTGY